MTVFASQQAAIEAMMEAAASVCGRQFHFSFDEIFVTFDSPSAPTYHLIADGDRASWRWMYPSWEYDKCGHCGQDLPGSGVQRWHECQFPPDP